MKLKHSVILLFVLLACLVTGCKKEKKSPVDNIYHSVRFDDGMQRTAADTTQILNETNKYVEALKAKQFDQALAMLCNFDKKGNPVPLTTQDKQQLMKVYKAYPVLNYSIEYFNIYSETDCEVAYKIEFFEKPKGSDIPNTIMCMLRPHRINGKWYMSIAKRFQEPDAIKHEYKDTSTTDTIL